MTLVPIPEFGVGRKERKETQKGAETGAQRAPAVAWKGP